ncbi:hypothetical protein K435DRAFT_857386 [Dendrothele bispora CBS 962.96]|uniref:Uncharacterized protein n=1 Tax=Dendrothele bispora (strain CBS 962.96) TaxID=1314807 RepID=A0A4S8M6H5_DENBC|nr:hypothetical protein K435DRAFT_857386 [Dendrothele bispora CBS 962.96]
MFLDALFTSDLVPARLVASYLPAIEVSGTKLLLLQQTLEGRFNDLSEDFGLSPSRFRRCLEENWSFVAGSHAIRCGLGGYTAAAARSPLDILVVEDKVEKVLFFLLSTGSFTVTRMASCLTWHGTCKAVWILNEIPCTDVPRQFRVYCLAQRRCDNATLLSKHLLSSPSTLEMTLFSGSTWLTLNAKMFVTRTSYVRQSAHICEHARSRKSSAVRFGFAPVTLNGQRRYPCDECPRRLYGPRLSSRASFICYRPMEPAVSRLISLDIPPEMFSVVCFNGDCPSEALMLHYPPTFYSSQLLSSLDQYLPWEAFCRGLTNFWPHTLRDDYVSSFSLSTSAFTKLVPSDVFRGGICPQVSLSHHWGTSIGIGAIWIVGGLSHDPAQLSRLL